MKVFSKYMLLTKVVSCKLHHVVYIILLKNLMNLKEIKEFNESLSEKTLMNMSLSM